MQGLQKYIVILSFSFTCIYSQAAIPPQQLVLEVEKVKVVRNTKSEISKEDVAKIIPGNLQPGQTQEEISLKVVDRSVNSFTQAEYFRSTEIGKAATGFEKSLRTNVNLGGDAKKGEVSHNMNLQVLAFEQKAWLHYQGFTDLQLTYLASNSHLNMELTENLGGSTKLVLKHDVAEQLSRANLSWNW